MDLSGSLWAPVCPCHRITLKHLWMQCRKVLYESLGIVRQHPNSTKNAPTEVQIRVGMRIFDEFRVFTKTASQERVWRPHNFFHSV